MPKATEVFTPGSFPKHTYVERSGEHLERELRDSLDTPGQVVSLAGPSKSGKTVLVEKVVGSDLLITIQGTGIRTPDEVWERVLNWMGTPAESTRSITDTGEGAAGVKLGGGASLFGLAKAETEGSATFSLTRASERSETTRRQGLPQVVTEIGDSDFVILLDDFHYMPREVQSEVAKSLKEGVRLGLKICVASVIHRADDVVRANPELRGRVRTIDLTYWKADDLKQIAVQGFRKLGVGFNDRLIERFAAEAAGSPQLMQLICLHSCFEMGIRAREETDDFLWREPSAEQCETIFERAASATDFRSLVDVLDGGPKTRGTDRIVFDLMNGVRGDVYRCVLTAIASDPPQLSFTYDELMRRIRNVCAGETMPTGSSITGSCLHMSKLAEKFQEERAVDWDEQKQVLDIPNPYLLFYLRWSGRLKEQRD